MDTAKDSAPAQPTTDEKLAKPDDTIQAHYASLERLEEKNRHDFLDDAERQELRDQVLRLRRKLSR